VWVFGGGVWWGGARGCGTALREKTGKSIPQRKGVKAREKKKGSGTVPDIACCFLRKVQQRSGKVKGRTGRPGKALKSLVARKIVPTWQREGENNRPWSVSSKKKKNVLGGEARLSRDVSLGASGLVEQAQKAQ